ncbi:uncharacterized protein LOC116010779 [Ipomoea triloba]|uniref:uncharacterized protein LOC116010779 n=1 Tax=Ipomoea triloba TaxID=35885 RepID=UPI00125D9603|nr:uncharacterized protein LOC116010779 [Ipomoea triloba]
MSFKVPSKIKLFMWTALHDKILGNAERKRRGLTMNGECVACHGQEETTAHILRDFYHAEEVWTRMIDSDRWRRWRQLNTRQWLEQNIMDNKHSDKYHEWARMFVISSWWICKTDYIEPTITEMRAIVEAMRWAWEKGIRDMEIQSDSREAVRWIREKTDLRGIARDLVNEAVCWCAKDWNISIRAIFREQNRSADGQISAGGLEIVLLLPTGVC